MATDAAGGDRMGEIEPASAMTVDVVSRALAGDELLETGLAAVGVSGWEADLASGKVSLSPWLRQLFGISDGGAATIPSIRARYHPDDRERVSAATSAAFSDPGRGAFRERFRVVRGDGSIVWLEARVAIFRDRDGAARRTIGVMLDVTKQMAREQTLEADCDRFAAALADSVITLFQQDLQLHYTWCHNPRLGYASSVVLGRTDAELMEASLAAPLERLKRTVLETGRAMRREVTTMGPRGRGTFDLHLEPLRDSRGAVIGITGASVELSVSPEGRRSRAARASLESRELLLDGLAFHEVFAAERTVAASLGTTALRRKLEIMGPLSAAAVERLARLDTRHRLVPAKTTLQDHATPSAGEGGGGMVPLLIANGWAVSYTMVPEGGRQILGFHLPGDLLGWPAAPPPSAGTFVTTLTECMISDLDAAVLEAITQSTEPLAAAFRWSSAMSEAIVRQHLVSLGRRTALARVAHLLLEIGDRLRLVGRADEAGFRCPLTQIDIADALGLTSVHVSRTLKQLREMGCLGWRDGFVSFNDRDRLIEIAGYDASFLAPQQRAAE